MPQSAMNPASQQDHQEFDALLQMLSTPSRETGEDHEHGNELLRRIRNDSNLISTLNIDEGLVNSQGVGQGIRLRGTSAQEKNRRAQKRFRERQKANINCMQDQMNVLKEEVERLKKENTDLASRNVLMDKMLRLSNDSILSLQQEHGNIGANYRQNAEIIDELQSDHIDMLNLDNLTEPDIQCITDGKKLLLFWKKLVKDVSVLLIQYDNATKNKDSRKNQIVEKISEILNSAGTVCMQAAVYSPATFEVLMGASFDNGISGVTIDDKRHWSSIVKSLELDTNQRYQFAALNSILKARMSKIVKACSENLYELKQAAPENGKGCLKTMATQTLTIHESSKMLQMKMYEEHLCRIEFWATIFKTVLSEVQKARCIVQSYPFFPDVQQMADLIDISVDEEAAALAKQKLANHRSMKQDSDSAE